MEETRQEAGVIQKGILHGSEEMKPKNKSQNSQHKVQGTEITSK